MPGKDTEHTSGKSQPATISLKNKRESAQQLSKAADDKKGTSQKDTKSKNINKESNSKVGNDEKSGKTGDAELKGSKDDKSELIRKFSLGGDAWNKKQNSTSSAASKSLKTAGGQIEEEPDDDERSNATESPFEKDLEAGIEPAESGDDSINVVVRVRPLNKNELERKDSGVVQFPGDGVLWIDNNGSIKPFTFNVLFEPEASQKDVFEHSGVKKLVSMAVDGYACTCFAFGQTGSGKTHSITGPPQKFQPGKKLEELDYGLIPRSFHNLLQLIKDGGKRAYTVTASYFELYNEQILDLLNVQGGKKLNMRWSAEMGFYIENLFTIECETFDDLMAVLEEGLSNRSTSAHNMNDNSSRSHSMLVINIDSEQPDPNDENLLIHKHGKLTFVDLAGSEKVKDTNTTGDQLLETNNINKSLLVLGKCISALGDPRKRNGHIPYRDSKLTKLLADSIGGSGVTLMIACVSPSKPNIGETMNTLRYATRAKKIKNKPVIKMDPRERMILTLKKEIKVLRAENQLLRDQSHFAHGDPKSTKNPSKDPKKRTKTGKEDANGNQDFTGENTDLYEMLQEYMVENEALRSENTEYLQNRDRLKRDQQYIVRENDRLTKKVEELQKFILVGDPTAPPVAFSSQNTSRQNSTDWYDPHSGMNSASSGGTLRSYGSVPDVYYASLNGAPVFYPVKNVPVIYRKPADSNLPPVKHQGSPKGTKILNSSFHTPPSNANRFVKPAQLARDAEFGVPLLPGSYAFQTPKNMTNVSGIQPNYTLPHQPMMAKPPIPPAVRANKTYSNIAYVTSPPNLPPGQVPHRPTYDPNPSVKNPHYDLNEQLKKDLMMLEGEIKHTQEALTTSR